MHATILEHNLPYIPEIHRKKIDINFAQRGDILYYKDELEWDGTLGVCIGSNTMFNWKSGMNIIMNSQCKYCWRIE